MFQTVFEKFSGFLDQRFIFSVWLPCLFFWLALLCLILGWAGPSVMLVWWQQQPVELQVAMTILLLAWITFFARLLLNVLGALVQVYEGYWERFSFLDKLMKRRKRYYAEKLGTLPYKEIYLRFPPATRPEEAMPTRLGNLLKNAELYPKLRYEMDAVLIWPRLYSVLPESMVKNFGAAAAELDLMLIISVLGVAFACLGGILATVILPWHTVPACILGGALVAWLGYEGALRSALAYNQLIKAAFDLHRGTLLKTIGWVPASSYDKEKIQWDTISKFWYQGPPPTLAGKRALGYEKEKKEDSVGYLWLRGSGDGVEGACLLSTVPKHEKPEKQNGG
jgi:hypothetical protein